MKTETMDNKLAKLGLALTVAVGLCILAKAAFAGNVAGASALQKNSTNANTSGLGLQLVVGADFNGNTSSGMTVSCSNCGGGGAGTVAVNVQNLPTPTPGIQPVSVTAAPGSYSRTAFTFVFSQTPVAIAIPTPVISGGKMYGTVCPNFGGPGILVEFSASQTPTAAFTAHALNGIPIATSASCQAWGPFYSPMYLIGKSNSAVNVNGYAPVYETP